MKSDTLKSKWPFGRTLLFIALFLSALFGALELAVHADPVQTCLAGVNPSLGGRLLQMEGQLARLERFANKEG
jgi:hypothetical protein